MHWLLDVYFNEDKTRFRSTEIQKNFNLVRKIVLNLIKEYQASLPKHKPLSRIMKTNLLEIEAL